MNSQIEFFMDSGDEAEFVESFGDHELNKPSDTQWWFTFGPIRIQFLRCVGNSEWIEIGRIGIRFNTEGPDEKRAAAVFRRMARHIKKSYDNHLTCRSERRRGNVLPIKNVWVGPGAAAAAKGGTALIQPPRGFVVYELVGEGGEDKRL